MIFHVIDFLVDYFTNINVKKIVGGILVLLGLLVIGKVQSSENANSAVLYAIGGILIGGVGLLIIYLDIALNKTSRGHNELDTIARGYKQKELEERKISTWHMNQDSDHKNSLVKKD